MADNKNNPPKQGGGGFGGGRFRPIQKPKDAKKTMMRLLKIYFLQKKIFIITLLLTVISSSIALIVPFLTGQAINTFDVNSTDVQTNKLFLFLIGLGVIYLFTYLIETLNGTLMTYVSQKLIRHIRTEFFNKLLLLPLNFYDTTPHGDTMSRLTNDIDNISSTIASTTTQLAFSFISIIGSLIMMLILSPLLTLVALITIPLVLILTKAISKKARYFFAGQQKTLGELNGIIEETINGLKIVKAFNRQETILDEFKEVNDTLFEYSSKAHMWSGFMMPFMNVINNLSFTFIATFGGIMSANNMISVGVIISFISYSRQFGQPLNNIAGMFNTIASALSGAERVFEILDEIEEEKDKEDCVKNFTADGNVTFKNVSFSYNENTSVLEDVSFSVKSGSIVALVGETGAGKTTIVNLLTRFYEVDSGEILIDDVNIKNIKRSDMQKCFSVVLQDTCLFSNTIADNIRYSNLEADIYDVKYAAKLALADDFITKLPYGYATMLNGSNVNLSQGQRQLLSMARAILINAPILILDEATSSVDTMTEKSIQKAMLTLMKNKTCFLIAHRLSTIKDADIIMVVGDKGIKEKGSHKELMALKGEYYNMVISSYGD